MGKYSFLGWAMLISSTFYIREALEESGANKTKVAERLGLKNYQTPNNWIEKYNIK